MTTLGNPRLERLRWTEVDVKAKLVVVDVRLGARPTVEEAVAERCEDLGPALRADVELRAEQLLADVED